jgi:hypothetical protein
MYKTYSKDDEQKRSQKVNSYYTKENGLDEIELSPPEDYSDSAYLGNWIDDKS